MSQLFQPYSCGGDGSDPTPAGTTGAQFAIAAASLSTDAVTAMLQAHHATAASDMYYCNRGFSLQLAYSILRMAGALPEDLLPRQNNRRIITGGSSVFLYHADFSLPGTGHTISFSGARDEFFLSWQSSGEGIIVHHTCSTARSGLHGRQYQLITQGAAAGACLILTFPDPVRRLNTSTELGLVLQGAANDERSSHVDAATLTRYVQGASRASILNSLAALLDKHSAFICFVLPSIRTACGHAETLLMHIADFAGVVRGRQLRNAREAHAALGISV